jgi:D-arginine dehydrogenase
MRARTADIVVIGAGIAGAGISAFLAEHAKVLLLEREDRPGYHSTGRSAAIFIESYGNAAIRALNRASRDWFLNPPIEELERSPFSRRDVLYICAPGEEARLDALCADNPHLVALTARETVAHVPILRAEAVMRGALETSSYDIDVASLHQGWLSRLKHLGSDLVCQAPVTSLERAGGVWRVGTPRGPVEAPVVVNAAGAWADEVAALAGLGPVGLTPCRRTAAILPAPAGHQVDGWPCFATVEETWYAKPEAGKLLVSPADQDPVPPHDVYVNDMVLAEGLDRYERAVTVPVTRVERSWAGLRTFAPDKTPVAGYDPRTDGFFWLAGQGGYGIQTAPALSRLACALVRGDETPESLGALRDALSPARFV